MTTHIKYNFRFAANAFGAYSHHFIATLMDAKKALSVGIDFPNGYVGHEVKKGLSVITAILFIAGELAGSGVLALPSALAGTGN